MLISATARRRSTEPPILTYTAAATLLVSDGRYNSFPGSVTCPNGDILAGYRAGNTHTTGGDIYTIRSTDAGATWGPPQLVSPAAGGTCYGTATLSVIDSGRIALVSWIRPNIGGTPYVDSTRIFISDDNGQTWDAPITVDTGPAWLGLHSVSESPLVFNGGAYYLGIWGVDAGEPNNTYYQAGVMRSTDLATFTRVAQFDTGTNLGFNECGVAAFGSRLVCVIRHESDGRWVSISDDGISWTDPMQAWDTYGQGAPKMATSTLLGHNLVPLRHPTYRAGFIAAVDNAGTITEVASLELPTTEAFMYGQVCRFSETAGAVVYSSEVSDTRADLYYRPFSLAVA